MPSTSKIWPNDHREDYIALILGPSTALYRFLPERCALTNKAVGTIWRDLSKPIQRREGPDPRSLSLLVKTPSALGPEHAYWAEHTSSILRLMSLDIFVYYFYYITCLCTDFY